jgi:superfamily II RNA helicase
MAQANKAKGEAVDAMKADGIDYEERMELLEEVTYPKPLDEGLRQAFDSYRSGHPWVRESDLSPKSVVRDMYEQGRTFTEFIAHYGLSRSEGLVLRYLSDAYRALRRTVPESMKTDEFEEIVDWLGETVRQTDSSLLDEWEALSDPDTAQRVADGEAVAPVRPVTGNERAFTRMVRNALFQRVQLAAEDRSGALGELDASNAALTDPPRRPVMSANDWHDTLGTYWEEYESIDTGPQGRSPALLIIDRTDPAVWRVRQIIEDPDGNHDFAIIGSVDLDASDAAGEPVVRVESFGAD